MIGRRMCLGILSRETKTFNPADSSISITKEEMIMAMKMPYISTGSSLNSNGPGWRPWIIKPPSSIAVAMSPGMPRVSRGTIAPPTEALFAVSVATTPSMIPVPNFSGYLEWLLAELYARRFEVDPPRPGRIPMPRPISALRKKLTSCSLNSFRVNPKPRTPFVLT